MPAPSTPTPPLASTASSSGPGPTWTSPRSSASPIRPAAPSAPAPPDRADGPVSAAGLAVRAGEDRVEQHVDAGHRLVDLRVLGLVVRDAVAAGREDHRGGGDA